ncbi:MAG: trypsin-like peptidase domain-containing protein [Phycisphaerae bacterium]
MSKARAALCLVLTITGAGPTLAQIPPADGRESRRTPIVRVIEECRDAVVNISTTQVRQLMDEMFDFGPFGGQQRVQSVGSGVVIHESGFIITNAHVVARASDVRVTFADKQAEPAEIFSVDAEHDLAVLKVNADRPLKALKLGRSDDIMVGETVVAIGNPLGLQHSVTSGIVSAIDRDLRLNERVTYRGLIQTDTPINPGNSGGPLINVNSELIGINTAIRGDAQNVGFAIPVDRIWSLLPSLLDVEKRQRVRFGVRVGGPEAIVQQVVAGSPAERAKLQPKDRVVQLDGQPVRDAIDYYVKLLARQPGDAVKLALDRGGRTTSATLSLEPVPLPDGKKLAYELLGLDIGKLSDANRRRWELPDDVALTVDGLERGGAAGQEGIQRGDLLLRINRSQVTNIADVGLALESASPGDRVLVEGLRIRNGVLYSWWTVLTAQRP